MIGIWPASFLDAEKPLEDHARIEESCLQQGYNEVAILLPERAELGDTEIFLVQAPTGELRLSGRRRRVGVLHFNQPIAPPIRERRRFQIDAVDAKPCSSSNVEDSPATPSIRSARRAVSSLLSAIGRMRPQQTWWRQQEAHPRGSFRRSPASRPRSPPVAR
jgi:hypothetical protein